MEKDSVYWQEGNRPKLKEFIKKTGSRTLRLAVLANNRNKLHRQYDRNRIAHLIRNLKVPLNKSMSSNLNAQKKIMNDNIIIHYATQLL